VFVCEKSIATESPFKPRTNVKLAPVGKGIKIAEVVIAPVQVIANA
jgi:hypothetical protein